MQQIAKLYIFLVRDDAICDSRVIFISLISINSARHVNSSFPENINRILVPQLHDNGCALVPKCHILERNSKVFCCFQLMCILYTDVTRLF